jgi:hypothetical protein
LIYAQADRPATTATSSRALNGAASMVFSLCLVALNAIDSTLRADNKLHDYLLLIPLYGVGVGRVHEYFVSDVFSGKRQRAFDPLAGFPFDPLLFCDGLQGFDLLGVHSVFSCGT